MIRTLACALIYLYVLPSIAISQTTWHVGVNGIAPGTGSAQDPYTSIQYAIDQPGTTHGDVLLIAPGTYIENLNLGCKSLTLRGSAGAQRTVIRPDAPGHLVDGIGCFGAWTFEGLTFTGVAEAESAAIITPQSAQSVWINDCVIANNAGYGILGAYDLYVKRTTVTNNRVGVDALASLTLMEFQDSIIWGNEENVGFVDFASFFWCNVGDSFYAGNFDSIWADPLFWNADSGDYHLRPGSPCIVSTINPSGADMGVFPFDAGYQADVNVHCVGGLNSVGSRGRIGHAGSTSISGADFVVTVKNGVPNQFGLFFFGGATNMTPFGDGNLCVSSGGMGIYRISPPQVLDASGAASQPIDFVAGTTGQGAGALLSGSTWTFQFWYRDPAGPLGSGFNLSNALTARFWE